MGTPTPPKPPLIGSGVHYVASGHSLGANTSTSTCRAALVTEVKNPTTVSLAVFTTKGTLFYADLTYDEGKAGGTWHWPEVDSGQPTSSIYPTSAKPPAKRGQPGGVASA